MSNVTSKINDIVANVLAKVITKLDVSITVGSIVTTIDDPTLEVTSYQPERISRVDTSFKVGCRNINTTTTDINITCNSNADKHYTR